MAHRKKDLAKIKITREDLRNLIYYARRYCDGRNTHAPFEFNEILQRVLELEPDIEERIPRDHTLQENGKYFPWAQTSYNKDHTGTSWDARPKTMQTCPICKQVNIETYLGQYHYCCHECWKKEIDK